MIDLESLNEQQRLAFDIITSQNGNENEPVDMIVCGTAGTGETSGGARGGHLPPQIFALPPSLPPQDRFILRKYM